jgi:hypothetical protein
MAMKIEETTRSGGAFVEFSPGHGEAAQPGVERFPREDVLQYIQEMCATLSYLSIAHKCERLSGLLAAAAAEAERNVAQIADTAATVQIGGARNETR